MKFVDLKTITKKIDVPLHYRNEYDAVLVLLDRNNSNLEVEVEFITEHNALGVCEITVKIKQAIDYPLIPIVRMLKKKISDFDKAGKLL